FSDELIADPLALILGKHCGGAKKPELPMTFHADTSKNLAPAAPRDEKASEVIFHPVVRQICLRKNLKNVVQTFMGGLLNGNELRGHIISSCKVDESYWRRDTAGAGVGAARFRKIVFEHDKHFPFVSVRVGHPGFILDGVTAGRLHLVA